MFFIGPIFSAAAYKVAADATLTVASATALAGKATLGQKAVKAATKLAQPLITATAKTVAENFNAVMKNNGVDISNLASAMMGIKKSETSEEVPTVAPADIFEDIPSEEETQ